MSTDGTPGGVASPGATGRLLRISVLHGISPSVFTLVTAPQDNFVGAGGTLNISDGNGTAAFPNCKIDQATFAQTAAGQVWPFRSSTGSSRSGWESSPEITARKRRRHAESQHDSEDAADAVLPGRREKQYDVGDIPNTTFPTFQVDSQPPAQVLADLCDSLGCRVGCGGNTSAA